MVGDRAERMRMLWGMACESRAAGNVADAVRCLGELNRMDGAYEPERVQVHQVSHTFAHLLDGMGGA